MKLLITGASGYLGGRLSQYFSKNENYFVLHGTRDKNKVVNTLPRLEAREIDWNNSNSIEQAVSGVDVIIHLAGMNAQDSMHYPIAAITVNAVGTGKLLQAAVRQNVKRFIYLSTVHVYGSELTGKITETNCPTNLHPYATSHRAGEDVVRNAHVHNEIEGIVVRLSNAFGVPIDKNANCWMLLINDLCRQVAVNKQMTLKTSGLQRRDFISLENLARAIAHIINLDKEQIGNGVFNIGGQWAPRIIDVAEIIKTRCNEVNGFLPKIDRPEPHINEVSLSLDYRINKLIDTGFSLISNTFEEIDATLIFCNELKA